MEKILAMRKDLNDEFAKKEFDLAMANAQSEFPEIKKTKSVPTKTGQIAYSYAPIDSIVRQVRDILAKYKLSYSIKTEITETGVKSICIVRHIAGHSEQSEMEVPLGVKTGVMSDSQVVAAASTFSKRYAFMNAFGIMTAEEDNEEALKEKEATEGQVEASIMLLEKCMTMDALRKTWTGLAKEVKANKEVIKKANEIKSNIENENSQNATA